MIPLLSPLDNLSIGLISLICSQLFYSFYILRFEIGTLTPKDFQENKWIIFNPIILNIAGLFKFLEGLNFSKKTALPKYKQKRKHSFLLIELLISLVLLSICFVPIVHSFNSLSQYKAEQIHHLEQRIATRRIFCELKEDLHKKAFESNGSSLKQAFKGEFSDISIGKHIYQGKYSLKEEKAICTKGAHIVSIQLYLKNQKTSLGPFSHPVLIQKEKRE